MKVAKQRRCTPEAQQLIVENKGLALYLARKFNAGFSDFSMLHELQSEAYLSLVICACDFDESHGVPFARYAAHCISYQLYNLRVKATRRRASLAFDSDNPALYTALARQCLSPLEQTMTNCNHKHVAAHMKPRDLQVLSMRHEGHGYNAIGEALNISRARVWQIITQSVKQFSYLVRD